MRPRGLRAPWKIHTPTWGSEVDSPSRQVEQRRALGEEFAAWAEESLDWSRHTFEAGAEIWPLDNDSDIS